MSSSHLFIRHFAHNYHKNVSRMASSLITQFINQSMEPNLYQIPVIIKTRRAEQIKLNAVFQDTKPEGSSIGTVVTIHGAPGSHKDFKYINPKLEDAGVRIIGINWPGLGYSDYDERLENHNYERVQFAQQIINALDNLSDKSVIFMGHSRGSENALKMAVKNKNKTIGFVSINPIGIRPHRGAHITAFKLMVNFWKIQSLRWLSHWLLLQLYTKFAKFKVTCGHICGVALQNVTSIEYSDAVPYIDQYNESDLRAFLIYGGRDWLIEPELSKQFLALFDGNHEIEAPKNDIDPETVQKIMKEISNGRKTLGVFCKEGGHFLQKDQGDLIAESILTMFKYQNTKRG